jgi:protein-tyrosine kinase
MTIEDAIRRAKLLGQARMQRDSGSAGLATEPRARSEPERGGTIPSLAPGAKLDPLKTVEISTVACEQNRVLVLTSQLREYRVADAAYRLLRSRLRNRFKQDNWFSMAVASPSQSDGKSLTLLNLAVSIARENQKPVYVMDLDMRNPSICRFLGIGDIRPLDDFFRGEAKPEDVIFHTSIPSLSIAGTMVPVSNASELLAGPRLGELLAHIRLRSPNACVLVDLPPVNVTDEALLVGPWIDAFLMVVSEGVTERKDVVQALHSLAEFTIAGVVLNKSSDSHTIEYTHYSA